MFISFLAMVSSAAASAAPLRVLYFTKSSGFEHSVVKRTNGEASFSETVLGGLAAAHDFEFTFSKDGSLFSKDYFSGFDVIMFYTSGDLLSVSTDGQPAVTPDGKQALLEAIAGGKGFVSVHSGSDTFHTIERGGGNRGDRSTRYKNYGKDADPFIQMLGGEFINHGKQQVARARVIDPAFPGFRELGSHVECLEEWYSLKDFAPDLHALLVLETAGMTGVDYQRPPFPLAWARLHGKGRVWYHAHGHREDTWTDARFQGVLLAAIKWAGRRIDADVTPNLATAAPEAATLPPAR